MTDIKLELENDTLNEYTYRNFDMVCRFCLARDFYAPQPIFNDFFDDDRIYVPEFVSSFTNLTITPTDDYPKFMCFKCAVLIEKFQKFRQNCLDAFDVLQRVNEKYKCLKTEEGEEEEIPNKIKEDNKSETHILGLVIEPLDIEIKDEAIDEEIEDTFKEEDDVSDNIPSSPLHDVKNNDELKSTNAVDDKPSLSGKCTVCGHYRARLDLHMKIHPNEGPYECIHCGWHFTKLYCLRRHRAACHPKQNRNLPPEHPVEIPNDNHQNASAAATNIENDEFEKPIMNVITTADIENDSEIKIPKRLSGKKKVYQCKKCDTIFKHPYHLKKHHRNKRSCYNRKHNVSNQKGSSGFCEICGVTKKYIDIHMISHREERKFACHLCDKRFKLKSILTRHIEVHLDERKYKCTGCEKAFNDPSSLRIHSVVHTGEKKYVCPICDRPFGSCSARARHVLSHTQNRKFECQYCQKKFLMKPQLTKHERIHTGEKPFQCKFCVKRFNVNANCQVHMKTVHRDVYQLEKVVKVEKKE